MAKGNSPPITPDRVTAFFGRKIQVKQYEPVDINIGYSSDVRDDETPEEAYERVSNFVKKKVAIESKKILNK